MSDRVICPMVTCDAEHQAIGRYEQEAAATLAFTIMGAIIGAFR